MAAHEGEERLLILFADVHYYFQTPTPRPFSHRFDKGSYLYLFRKQTRGGGRIEIANNVGKAEQDAFTGLLELATIRQSHKHPTLCTITVDGFEGQRNGPVQHEEHHWRLPNTDPRNEGKFLFRLHTLDIYFWKAEDANSFMNSVSAFLEQGQVEILDAPPAPASPVGVTSPVVQKLENVAIRDPAYQNGRTRNSQSTAQSMPVSGTPQAATRHDTPKIEDSTAFKPMAYNPAAPPAPEPIRHREKTPPPPESEQGTGLAAAAGRDHAQNISPLPSPLPAASQHSMSRPPYSHSALSQGHITSPPGQGYASPPSSQGYAGPPHPLTHGTPFASPPPSSVAFSPPPSTTPGQRTPSVTSLPPPPQSGRTSASPYTSTSAIATPSSHRASVGSQQLPQGMSFGLPPRDPNVQPYGAVDKPLTTPTTDLLGSSYVGGTHQPLQHLQPQYADYLSTRHSSEQQQQQQQQQQKQQEVPIGGYSNYEYTPQTQHHHQLQQGQGAHEIHEQFYRPTEEEAQRIKPHRPSDAHKTGRVDKGVNRFLKKIEKNFG